MPMPSIARSRLVAQRLVGSRFASPLDALNSFVAMQGQDLPGVISSVALRTESGSVDEVLAALNSGELVRGYPMRGTVFLMPATDVAWVTQLCAGPAIRAAELRRGTLELSQRHVELARDVSARVLEPGPLKRDELLAHWVEAGIDVNQGRGYHLLSALISETTLCHGPWSGTEQAIALRAQWAPNSQGLAEKFDSERVPAAARLFQAYAESHGPVTVRDFAWWTKLPMKEIRLAVPLASPELEFDPKSESYARRGLAAEVAAVGRGSSAPLLLPGFDEFILGYQDRLFAITEENHPLLVPGNNGVFKRCAVSGGVVQGTWRRGGTPAKRKFELAPFGELSPTLVRKFEAAFARFPFPTP